MNASLRVAPSLPCRRLRLIALGQKRPIVAGVCLKLTNMIVTCSRSLDGELPNASRRMDAPPSVGQSLEKAAPYSILSSSDMTKTPERGTIHVRIIGITCERQLSRISSEHVIYRVGKQAEREEYRSDRRDRVHVPER